MRYLADTMLYNVAHIVSRLDQPKDAPTARNLAALQHLTRYISGHKDIVFFYRKKTPAVLDSNSDSDFAACPILAVHGQEYQFDMLMTKLIWLGPYRRPSRYH